MSWSILPELSAWHAASLLSKGHEGMREDVADGLQPLVDRIGAVSIDNQVNALTGANGTSLNDSFELYEAISKCVSVADELPTRIGPLKMQWQARGPGMIAELARFILGRDVSPPTVDDIQILPVYPWAGGHVQPLPQSAAILVEAVLTDASPELPESVRLAWGHAQLFSHTIFAAHRTRGDASIHALATIMPVLAAAETVQLARCDAATTERAITMWLGNPPPADAVNTLVEWWNEWSRQLEAAAADWPLAVSALGA